VVLLCFHLRARIRIWGRFFLTCSRCQWNLISICFDLLCETGSFDRVIAAWLSPKIVVGILFVTSCSPISWRNFFNHRASLPALNCPMYSASEDDVATVVWRFEVHEMGQSFIWKIYPDVDRRPSVTTDPPWSVLKPYHWLHNLNPSEDANWIDNHFRQVPREVTPWVTPQEFGMTISLFMMTKETGRSLIW